MNIRCDEKEDRNIKKQLAERKGIDASVLKYIAIITMLIDHIGAVLVLPMVYEQGYEGSVYVIYQILRNIGRVAFPIFCFFLVEGFCYTKDVKKYAMRLLIFAFISEIPFDLAFKGGPFKPDGQNVYFTLLIGLLVLMGLRYLENRMSNVVAASIGRVVILLAGCVVASILKTDYHAYGIISIAVLYLYRNEWDRKVQLFMGAITFLWEPWAVLAFPLLYLYNGQRGRQPKYLFYIFYPAHILALYGISQIL